MERAMVDQKRVICERSTSLAEAQRTRNHEQYAEHRAGRKLKPWVEHAKLVHQLIEKVVKEVPRKEHAVVLGAGVCMEVPLQLLARRFRRVTLVDLDRQSMEFALDHITRVPFVRSWYRRNIGVLEGDVSTMVLSLAEELERIIKISSATGAKASILQTLQAIGQGESFPLQIPLALEDQSADFVISSDVLRSLNALFFTWVDTIYRKTFGEELGLEAQPTPLQGQISLATIAYHMEEIHRLLKPEGTAFIEAMIAYAPVLRTPFGIQIGGHTPQVGMSLSGFFARPASLSLAGGGITEWVTRASEEENTIVPVSFGGPITLLPGSSYLGAVYQAATLAKQA